MKIPFQQQGNVVKRRPQEQQRCQSFSTVQQQEVHKEISEVMGKKVKRVPSSDAGASSSSTTTQSSSSRYQPANQLSDSAKRQQQRERTMWALYGTFATLVLLGQYVKKATQNRFLKQEIVEYDERNEELLVQLRKLVSVETVQSLVERCCAAADVDGDSPAPRASSLPTSSSSIFSGWLRPSTTLNQQHHQLDEQPLKSRLKSVIQQELAEMIQGRNAQMYSSIFEEKPQDVSQQTEGLQEPRVEEDVNDLSVLVESTTPEGSISNFPSGPVATRNNSGKKPQSFTM
ncbi:hypothetical protein ACA910_000824 [Epithemia clementina (nom. ined.)]